MEAAETAVGGENLTTNRQDLHVTMSYPGDLEIITCQTDDSAIQLLNLQFTITNYLKYKVEINQIIAKYVYIRKVLICTWVLRFICLP